MADTTRLIEIDTARHALPKVQLDPIKLIEVRFFFKATAAEVTAQKVRGLLELAIEDLNYNYDVHGRAVAPLFKSPIEKENFRFDGFKVNKDGMLEFEVVINDVNFNGTQYPNGANDARTRILRTLNAYLPAPK